MPDDQQPHGSGNGSQGGNSVTPDQLNKALSSHAARQQKAIADAVATAMTAALAPVLEKLSAPADPPPADPPKPGDPPPDDPATRALENKVTAMAKELAESKLATENEAAKRRNQVLRAEVVDNLGSAGINGDRQLAAIASLYHTGLVKVTDDGTPLFVGPEGELPLADGLKTWAASDGAKLYHPPSGVGGSGDGGAKPAPRLITGDNKLQAAHKVVVEGAGKLLRGIQPV